MNHREKSEALLSTLVKILKGSVVKKAWNEDTINISIISPNSRLFLWFDTESNEVSIGINDLSRQETVWHLHVFMDGAKSGMGEIEYASKFIGDVLDGKIRFNLKAVGENRIVNREPQSPTNKMWSEL